MHRDRTATIALALLLAMLLACAGPPALECTLPPATASLPAELREASGAAFNADGTLWLIADSGSPLLYGLGADDRIVARVRVTGVHNDDWEDLAVGPCGDGQCLYIGEIGDNLHEASELAILRVRAPAAGQTRVPADRLRFRYPDGPRDAEALAALHDGSLLIISKGRNGPIGVYRYPPPLRADSVVTLRHVQDLSAGIAQLPQQVTGAAAAPDGRTILVRTYATMQHYAVEGAILRPIGPPVDLAPLAEPQGEGIASGPGGLVVLVGEGRPGDGTLARLHCEFP